ncbi:GspE/PulE family protein [Oribacterium sp. WCC10]|uniref:GspE/PulE family protein n=1 Tax=Oribacterium sp. WCC10 TaxID=1855343 RepID=UPI0008F41338|nr:GspE/PulE family protein [Oribacterium sp. WCC10]SFG18671.1 type IV pilus assembly protein PilB [Oribacterium sp. WCC10]
MRTKRLGDMLVELNLLTEQQLSEALSIQKKEHERLGTTLVEHGYITESQMVEALRMQLGIDYINLTKTDIAPEMSQYIPKNLAKQNRMVPVSVSKDNLFLAMADPTNFMAIEEAKKASKKNIIPMIAAGNAVDHAINTLYGNEGAAQAMAQMRAEAGITDDEIASPEDETIDSSEESAPTIRLVNSIIERAYIENASDIHWEPTDGDLIIRMRIDGRLHKILTIPRNLMEPVISRIKIMSRMDIIERRLPQDGRARVRIKGQDIDLRISTLPSIYGENIVIRILRRDGSKLNRRGIGIPEEEDAKISKLLGLTSGVIMIVGPTGSGKSSTMYALVNELLSESTNLITLEDPVEYNINGAIQVQINEKVGLTFASGLRSILRQDPDIICVGEIRDSETAEIAMRAAMTGHLVITTIHTEDAISAIDRLKDMGVAPYLISAGLRGIISQRLLRRICINCKEEEKVEPERLRMAGIKERPGRIFYHGRGCDMCFNTGYRGRIGDFEVLVMNDALRECITKSDSKQEFQRLAKETGYVTMLENADRLVEAGITTVDEVMRTVTELEDY